MPGFTTFRTKNYCSQIVNAVVPSGRDNFSLRENFCDKWFGKRGRGAFSGSVDALWGEGWHFDELTNHTFSHTCRVVALSAAKKSIWMTKVGKTWKQRKSLQTRQLDWWFSRWHFWSQVGNVMLELGDWGKKLQQSYKFGWKWKTLLKEGLGWGGRNTGRRQFIPNLVM